MTQSLEELLPRLYRLGQAAKRSKSLKFSNLLHHISLILLQKAFYQLNKKASKGVDNLGWHDYEKDVLTRLKGLHHRLQGGRYKAQPVKRLWIPKGNGEERPIGVTAIEDKIVQQTIVWLLEPIYEEDFLGFSYGFRPERNQHQALNAVYMAISVKKVSWILDADLKGFFDRINHQWMMDFLEQRIADKRIHRLIKGWLSAGVLENQCVHKSRVGTPQGAVISPLLANIYLHYALDLWVQQWRKRHARGEVYIIRYADDYVIGLQYESDGIAIKQALEKRLSQFHLSFNEEKTQLIEFGRFARSNRQARGQRKAESFDFLGFTHICSQTKLNGKFQLVRHSIKKRFRAKLKEIKEQLNRRRHISPYETGLWIRRVLTGYFNYFAVPSNGRVLKVMRTEVCRMWLKSLRRRSHKGQSFNWRRMTKLVNFFIPHTRIRHPYPNQRFHL